MRTFLSIALITGCLTLVAGVITIQSQPASQEQQAKRPVQIVALTPEENATSINPHVVVSVNFEFLRGQRPILPASLKLSIDGVDVTKRSRIAASEDSPASRGQILFKPPQPFSIGKHIAAVRYTNDQNQQFSYTWHFYVSGTY